MAVESNVNADDDWFVGEDRQWQFEFVAGDTSDVVDWTMNLAFYQRRAKDTDPPLLSVPVTGVVGGPDTPDKAVATVTAAESLQLGRGIFQFVLRRTDVGYRSVLSYGSAELRSPVSA